MIYKLRIISDEIKDFAREILVDSSNSFLDFHRMLQEDLNYDPSQLASFFITNASWEKELQITLIDMMDEESEKVITMEDALIGDYLKKKGQRLLYVYDFFSERFFFLELTEVISNIESTALPKIIFTHGEPPPQIDLGLDQLTTSDSDDDDLFSNGFEDEDLFPGTGLEDPDDFSDE
ncbi:MAG: plasmid pRiA4b ORF-3 family protein [Bacteroidales bacterium]|nr:plasmid pRiA4b ORF-3 family protein [Bacteroidales bacterium]